MKYYQKYWGKKNMGTVRLVWDVVMRHTYDRINWNLGGISMSIAKCVLNIIMMLVIIASAYWLLNLYQALC